MDVLTPIISSLKPKGENKGEADELKCKKTLFENRKNIPYGVKLFGNDAEEGFEVINPTNGIPYEDISELTKKTKSTSKSDITILFIKTQKLKNISIKSMRGKPPSILNHTRRSANVFQVGDLKDDVINLDILAKEYHAERKKEGENKKGEDIKLCKLNSYANDDVKKSILTTLKYFIFTGTGKKKSNPECNAILVMKKDGSKTYNSCNTEEEKEAYVKNYIDIDHCAVSFRNKGMGKKICEQDIPWVCHYGTKDCGAIHIRLALK
jgi:hypothetical protein